MGIFRRFSRKQEREVNEEMKRVAPILQARKIAGDLEDLIEELKKFLKENNLTLKEIGYEEFENLMMNERQIQEKIEREEIRILEEVLKTESAKPKMGRPIGTRRYPNEQFEFLKENKDVPMKELVGMFNKKFKTSFPLDTRVLYNFMYRSGLVDTTYQRDYFPRNPVSIEKDVKNRTKTDAEKAEKYTEKITKKLSENRR